MMSMEQTLVDRCIKRASDLSGTPYTRTTLVERCSLDISYDGPEARTSVQMKGVRGHGLRKNRRLLPSGPLGEILFSTSAKKLHIEFPSVELLVALRGQSAAFQALAGYYTDSLESRYPKQMQLELALQFAHEQIGVEIDPDVVEAVIQSIPSGPFGNSRLLIYHLLEVEHAASKRRWKSVDLAKWRSAGLTWPVVRLLPSRPIAPKPEGTVSRVSDRHAELLRLFDQADETGKLHIEQGAAFAVAARQMPG